MKFSPYLYVLIAAVLFGINAPLSKLLLKEINPLILAGLLYIGSGLGFLIYQLIQHKGHLSNEAPLTKADIPWLAGAILSGGVTAPIILLIGLTHIPAATASLLLNFEGVSTTVLALIIFKEFIGKRIWIAIALITTGSVILSSDFSNKYFFSVGSFAILLACLLWGLDNNLTRNISAKNPIIISMFKCLIGGTISIILGFISGGKLPSFSYSSLSMLLGFISYGLSIMFFILALRELGAARTSAGFSIAPFIGTGLSLIIFHQVVAPSFLIVLILMVGGVILLMSEQHIHKHEHLLIEHDHPHTHDDSHHLHVHHGIADKNLNHSHLHQHPPVVHEHPHTPDIHHRHKHTGIF